MRMTDQEMLTFANERIVKLEEQKRKLLDFIHRIDGAQAAYREIQDEIRTRQAATPASG